MLLKLFKKTSAILILLLFLLVFVISSSPAWMKQFAKAKYNSKNALFRAEKYRYGDLYGITFLSRYKIPQAVYNPRLVRSAKKNIRIYAMGDSYIASNIQPGYFKGVDSIFFTDWRDPGRSYSINPQFKNVLIIETTERTFLHKFGNTDSLKYPFVSGTVNQINTKKIPVQDYIFNKGINTNLEFAIFDNPLFTYAKQWRADMNYILFKKIPSAVTISNDSRFLFLTTTVDSNYYNPTESSSFKSIPDSLLGACISNCNLLARHYMENGFSSVYFSVIPNPVSVFGFKPYSYNQLLPKIENSRDRKFNFIDMYPAFLIHKEMVYQPSDSHWTDFGLQMWIDSVNSKLK